MTSDSSEAVATEANAAGAIATEADAAGATAASVIATSLFRMNQP